MPVVGHLDADLARRPRDGHDGGGAGRVLDDVGQGFLCDSVPAEVDARWDAGRPCAVDDDPGPDAGRRRLGCQGRDLVEAGRRCQVGEALVVASEHGQHPAHLGEGVPAAGLDGAESLGRDVRLRAQPVEPDARLNGDEADGVRDDVVQLASDPQPLGVDRVLGQGEALALQLSRSELVDLRVGTSGPDQLGESDDASERDCVEEERAEGGPRQEQVRRHDQCVADRDGRQALAPRALHHDGVGREGDADAGSSRRRTRVRLRSRSPSRRRPAAEPAGERRTGGRRRAPGRTPTSSVAERSAPSPASTSHMAARTTAPIRSRTSNSHRSLAAFIPGAYSRRAALGIGRATDAEAWSQGLGRAAGAVVACRPTRRQANEPDR